MYGLDLSKVTLDDFKDVLLNQYLIPSQLLLREDIERNFSILKSFDLDCMKSLHDRIKSKSKAEKFSLESGLDENYVQVLRRAVASYIPKARKLVEYITIDDDIKSEMLEKGLNTSIKVYDQLMKEESLNEAQKAILSLMDVSRLRYVSPLFATALVESGYDSISKIADADINKMYERMIKTNQEKSIYKGNIGKSDIRFLVDDAKLFIRFL